MKDKILICARDLFVAEGLPHFSMRKVAACVGVSATALYRHFADKEALLFQVLLRGFQIFGAYLQRVDERQPPLVVLEQTAMAYLEFALAEPAYYEVMFMSSDQTTGLKRLNQDGCAEMSATFEILQRRVQRAIESGAATTGDSYTAAFGYWAYVHGLVSLFLSGRARTPQSEFVDVYRRLVSDHWRW